jgi:threonine dehydratase
MSRAGRDAVPVAPSAGCGSPNPFLRYRQRLTASHLAREFGKTEEWFERLASAFDDAVAGVEGRGFTETPFRSQARLAARLGFEGNGQVWVKDETGSVSGSHKGRHLAGIMLALRVLEEARGRDAALRPPLAIASCGNAALAAAVVARAASWPLRVFVPRSANPRVLERLEALEAGITVCERQPGHSGDPCYHAFRQEVVKGAIPFCCQGPDNGLTLEGGETLAWEMLDTLGTQVLDALFVQVGGGALASSVARALRAAVAGGRLARLPRIYAVQTQGGYPLARAYDRVVEWLGVLRGHPAAITEAMTHARHHRSAFMWPWPSEPQSIAHGILDDETYDWAAVVEAMLLSGGRPVVVPEEALRAANEIGVDTTGICADHTGTAGLAGLLTQIETEPSLLTERVAVLFTGARR